MKAAKIIYLLVINYLNKQFEKPNMQQRTSLDQVSDEQYVNQRQDSIRAYLEEITKAQDDLERRKQEF